jgi:hypothetical protein
MPVLPFEAVIVAALNFGSKIMEFAIKHREGMSQENKDRWDAVQVAGVERIERILAAVDKLGQIGKD